MSRTITIVLALPSTKNYVPNSSGANHSPECGPPMGIALSDENKGSTGEQVFCVYA
jgi:hypothetical protein